MKPLPCVKCRKSKDCKEFINSKRDEADDDRGFDFDEYEDLEFSDQMIDYLTSSCKRLDKYFPHEVGLSYREYNTYPEFDENDKPCKIPFEEWEERSGAIHEFFSECWPNPSQYKEPEDEVDEQ